MNHSRRSFLAIALSVFLPKMPARTVQKQPILIPVGFNISCQGWAGMDIVVDPYSLRNPRLKRK